MAENTSYTEQVTRQAPWLEDYQRRLLASTATLTNIPQYDDRGNPIPGTGTEYKIYDQPELAAFSADQLKSFDLARAGVGSYAPWLAESGVYARGAPATFAAAVPEAQALYRASTGAYTPFTTSYGGIYSPLAMAPGSRYSPLSREAQGLYSALPERAGAKYTPLTQEAGSKFGATAFDPSTGVSSYMSPYLSAVKDVTMSEIDREAAKARSAQSARAAASGAFGGARHGIESAELDRGILEKKAQALANLNQQGYTQALQASMGEHGRQQAALMQAHEAQRQAGLGERGRVSQQQQAAWEAQRQAELAERARVSGTSAQAYESQQARRQAELGRFTQQQQAAHEAQRQAELAERARYGQAGQTAFEAAQARRLQEFARGQAAAQQAYEAQQGRRMGAAQGLAGLGQTGAGLLQQSSAQMAGLGGLTQQYGAADVSMLSQSGALQQQQLQKAMDIDKQRFIESQMQPYQRMSFMSDILRGVPSTQSALTANTGPRPSAAAQGIGGMAAIAGIGGSEDWWGKKD